MSEKTPDPYHLDELERRRRRARAQGGPEKIERQHSLGRLTARQRIDELLDDDSFEEIGLLAHSDRPEARDRTPADGKVCGYGTVEGRGIYVSADDVTDPRHTRFEIVKALRRARGSSGEAGRSRRLLASWPTMF